MEVEKSIFDNGGSYCFYLVRQFQILLAVIGGLRWLVPSPPPAAWPAGSPPLSPASGMAPDRAGRSAAP